MWTDYHLQATVDLALRSLHWKTNWVPNGQSLNPTPNNYIYTVEIKHSMGCGAEGSWISHIDLGKWWISSPLQGKPHRVKSFIFYLKTLWTNPSGYLTGKLSRIPAPKEPNSYAYQAATNHSSFHPQGFPFRSLTGSKTSLGIYASQSSFLSKPSHWEPPTAAAASLGCGYFRNKLAFLLAQPTQRAIHSFPELGESYGSYKAQFGHQWTMALK